MLKVAVITVSDQAYRGEYKDISEPRIKQLTLESGIVEEVTLTVVPDDKGKIREALR